MAGLLHKPPLPRPPVTRRNPLPPVLYKPPQARLPGPPRPGPRPRPQPPPPVKRLAHKPPRPVGRKSSPPPCSKAPPIKKKKDSRKGKRAPKYKECKGGSSKCRWRCVPKQGSGDRVCGYYKKA